MRRGKGMRLGTIKILGTVITLAGGEESVPNQRFNVPRQAILVQAIRSPSAIRNMEISANCAKG